MATNDLFVGYTRRFAAPVDSTATFSTLSALQTYASSDPTAYAGQICAVTGTNTVYVINTDKTVSAVGSGSGGGGSYNQSLNTTDHVEFASVNINATETSQSGHPIQADITIGTDVQDYLYGYYGIFIGGSYNGADSGKVNLYVNPDSGYAVLDYTNTQTLLFPHQIVGGQIYGSGNGPVSGNWVLNADGTASFVNGTVTIDSNGQLTLPDIGVALTCKGGAGFGFNGGDFPNFTIDESGNISQYGYATANLGGGGVTFGQSGAYVSSGGSAAFQGLEVLGGNPTSLDGGIIYTDGSGTMTFANGNARIDTSGNATFNGEASVANATFNIDSSGNTNWGYFAGSGGYPISFNATNGNASFALNQLLINSDGSISINGGTLSSPDGIGLFWNGVQIA
jgi:hypothetical protein